MGEKADKQQKFLQLISLIIWAISEVFSQALNRNQLRAKHKTKGARKSMLFKQVYCVGSPRVCKNNYKFCQKQEATEFFLKNGPEPVIH